MKRVNTIGLYHYEVSGIREMEAGEKLEQRLDFICRDYRNPYTLDDIRDAVRNIAAEYGVEIKAVV